MPFNKEMSDLVFQVKVLKDRLDSFENGRKYTQLKEKHSRELSQRDRTIKSLRKNLKDARSQIAYNRNRYKEYMIRDKEKAEQKLNEVKDEMYQYKHQLADASKEIARLKAELADKDNQIALLKSRLNKDYTNSSKPSSQSPDHKTIPNGRKKSGKRPGGQQGHEHHPRKLHKPTKVVAVPVPEKYWVNLNFC
jgi:chromosome segregation ATPase